MRLITLLLIGLLVSGCSREPTTPPPPTAEQSVPDEKKIEPAPEPPVPADPPTSDEILVAEKEDQVSPDTDNSSPAQEPEARPASPPLPSERLAILLTGGPLLVDLTLTIGGKSHAEGMSSLVDHVLAAADTNEDGRSTWRELLTNQKFLYGPLANLSPGMQSQPRQWKEEYDLNDNNRVERGEAESWLGRDSGRSARALRLEETRSSAGDQRWNSHVWQIIDEDKNGLLTSEEMSQAASKLQVRDVDDDHVLRPSELMPVADQLRTMMGQTSRRRSESGHKAAMLLQAGQDLFRLQDTLIYLYSPRRDLTPQSFPQFPELFSRLDENTDGYLSQEDLARLTDLEPHLKIHLDFGSSTDGGMGTPIMDLDGVHDVAGKIVQATNSRAVLANEDARVVFAARDQVATNDPHIRALQVLTQLDQDTNNYLEEEELTGEAGLAANRFIAYDTDDDGMLVVDEIAEFLQLQQAVQQSQLRLVVHDRTDGLFAALDQNKDGLLGEREIATAGDAAMKLDSNANGRIEMDELPSEVSVLLLRGDNRQFDDIVAAPPTTPPAERQSTGPTWFRRSDFNGDGDLSPREFIGSPEHFYFLDADGNGFLDAKEAERKFPKSADED